MLERYKHQHIRALQVSIQAGESTTTKSHCRRGTQSFGVVEEPVTALTCRQAGAHKRGAVVVRGDKQSDVQAVLGRYHN
jgi:hypothetical protein